MKKQKTKITWKEWYILLDHYREEYKKLLGWDDNYSDCGWKDNSSVLSDVLKVMKVVEKELLEVFEIEG